MTRCGLSPNHAIAHYNRTFLGIASDDPLRIVARTYRTKKGSKKGDIVEGDCVQAGSKLVVAGYWTPSDSYRAEGRLESDESAHIHAGYQGQWWVGQEPP